LRESNGVMRLKRTGEGKAEGRRRTISSAAVVPRPTGECEAANPSFQANVQKSAFTYLFVNSSVRTYLNAPRERGNDGPRPCRKTEKMSGTG
jgi:hypothetical protein